MLEIALVVEAGFLVILAMFNAWYFLGWLLNKDSQRNFYARLVLTMIFISITIGASWWSFYSLNRVNLNLVYLDNSTFMLISLMARLPILLTNVFVSYLIIGRYFEARSW